MITFLTSVATDLRYRYPYHNNLFPPRASLAGHVTILRRLDDTCLMILEHVPRVTITVILLFRDSKTQRKSQSLKYPIICGYVHRTV
jgi:uracil phosphoribosyltransferase